MESVNAHLSLVKEKFGPFSGRIQELYDTDADFQSLCADYFLCMKFLRQYEAADGKKNVLREYVDISKALEKELYDFINQATS